MAQERKQGNQGRPDADDFEACLQAAVEEETPIAGKIFQGWSGSGLLGARVDFRSVRLEKCRFWDCDFEGASFFDVVWLDCDFSNCSFARGFFKKVRMENCKGQGADFREASIRDAVMRNVNLDYANWNRSVWDQAEITGSSFVSASLSEARLKKIRMRENRFEGTDFFRTLLKGLDFSECEVGGLLLSDTWKEVEGAMFSPWQAVELAKRLGIVVV